MCMSNAAIEVQHLRKVYPGGVEAVAGIDFEVAPGEVFGLLGPNGAGKSTTIGMLTTTVAPTSGRARVAGFDVVAHPLAARRASAVVFQEAVVDRALTGQRNLEVHARLWGLGPAEARVRAAQVAAQFGLTGITGRTVATYSGGQRRRLEIARSLLSRPQVLFLDEPTVGLDPRIRFELLDVIGGLRSHEDMTIVLTTHYLDEAERLCDRIAIVHAGRIVALDSPRALLTGLGTELVELRVEGDVDAVLSFLRARGAAGHDAFAVGTTITVPLKGRSAREVIDVAADFGAPLSQTTTRPPTLDDVYLRLTGDRLAA
jgi:ABC-2 type transport system ATP-binding protein